MTNESHYYTPHSAHFVGTPDRPPCEDLVEYATVPGPGHKWIARFCGQPAAVFAWDHSGYVGEWEEARCEEHRIGRASYAHAVHLGADGVWRLRSHGKLLDTEYWCDNLMHLPAWDGRPSPFCPPRPR